jgi:hypothetical protein
MKNYRDVHWHLHFVINRRWTWSLYSESNFTRGLLLYTNVRYIWRNNYTRVLVFQININSTAKHVFEIHRTGRWGNLSFLLFLPAILCRWKQSRSKRAYFFFSSRTPNFMTIVCQPSQTIPKYGKWQVIKLTGVCFLLRPRGITIQFHVTLHNGRKGNRTSVFGTKALSAYFTDDKWQDRLRQQSSFEAYKCRKTCTYIYLYKCLKQHALFPLERPCSLFHLRQ